MSPHLVQTEYSCLKFTGTSIPGRQLEQSLADCRATPKIPDTALDGSTSAQEVYKKNLPNLEKTQNPSSMV